MRQGTPRLRLMGVLLGGAVAVVLFDALAAVASRQIGFDYSVAMLGSWLLYAAVGHAAARVSGWRVAPVAGAVIGLVDASAGWAVSWMIGPGRTPTGTLSMAEWIASAVTVIVLAAVVAALGGLTARAPTAEER